MTYIDMPHFPKFMGECSVFHTTMRTIILIKVIQFVHIWFVLQ